MTRERIEDMREVVLPFVKKRLLETNYENLGESDAEMFAKDFDEILNLAIKALEQEPFINKPCISSGVCEHDKQKVLEKVRAEISEYGSIMVAYAITKDTKTDKGIEKLVSGVLKQAKEQVLNIIDKHMAESEPQESEDK